MAAIDTFLKGVVQGANERPYSDFWQGAKEVAEELLSEDYFDAREIYVREFDNLCALGSNVPDGVYQRASGRYRLAREVARRCDPWPPNVPEAWCEACNTLPDRVFSLGFWVVCCVDETQADMPKDGPCDGCFVHYIPDPAFEGLDQAQH